MNNDNYREMLEKQRINISNKVIKVLQSSTYRTGQFTDDSAPLSLGRSIDIIEFTLIRLKNIANSQHIADLFDIK